MEDALPILDYLPTTFAVPGEQEYVRLLWAAFESNYEQENFQFAMLPYHMLYMSFVYFSVWQIKLMRPKEFDGGGNVCPRHVITAVQNPDQLAQRVQAFPCRPSSKSTVEPLR